MPRRPELLRATERSEQILTVEIPRQFHARDVDRVPALVFARGSNNVERARDADTRNALFLLEYIDELIEVHPCLVDEIEPDHDVVLTRKGRAWLAEYFSAQAARAGAELAAAVPS